MINFLSDILNSDERAMIGMEPNEGRWPVFKDGHAMATLRNLQAKAQLIYTPRQLMLLNKLRGALFAMHPHLMAYDNEYSDPTPLSGGMACPEAHDLSP